MDLVGPDQINAEKLREKEISGREKGEERERKEKKEERKKKLVSASWVFKTRIYTLFGISE